MIKIWKNYDHVPEEIALTFHDIEVLRCGQAVSKQYQKDETSIGDLSTLRGMLRHLYHSTCGYCEGKFPPYQIEHYRPRKAKPTKSAMQWEKHAGYAWLCHEWSNLLYSCGACNGGKLNQWPIHVSGQRVQKPPAEFQDWRANATIMQGEKPYLLNPELDAPEEHLYFCPTGTICFATERGEETIHLCKLNRYDLVIRSRKYIIDQAREDIRQALLNFDQGYGGQRLSQQAFKQKLTDCFKPLICRLVQGQLHTEPFSLLHWHILHDIEIFCIAQLPQEIRAIFQKMAPLWRDIQCEFEEQVRIALLKNNMPEIFTRLMAIVEQQAVSQEKFNQELKYLFIPVFYDFVFLLGGNQQQFFHNIEGLAPIQQKLLKQAWKLCCHDGRWRFQPIRQTQGVSIRLKHAGKEAGT